MKKKGKKGPKSEFERTFVIASTFFEELWIIFVQFCPICLAALCEYSPQVIANIFIGHLSNASTLEAAYGLARTFTSVFGYAISSGMTSALHTFVPQAIGARRLDLLSIYVQRAFFITLACLLLFCVLQAFAGEIMITVLKQPSELKPYVTTICLYLIIQVAFKTWLSILQRVAQSLNYNYYLMGIYVIFSIIAYPFNVLLVDILDLGYIGAILAMSFSAVLEFIAVAMLLTCKKYYSIFNIFAKMDTIDKNGNIHQRYALRRVLSFHGVREYLELAIPATVQSSFEWWISEIGVILCGYVNDPTIALSATVIISLVNGVCIMFWYGTQMVITMRVGKYIGANMIYHAQRSAIAGLLISIVLSIIVGACLVQFNHDIPYLFTNDKEIVDLCSYLLYVLAVMQFFVCLYNNLNAIFRGIGYQSKAMWIVMIGFYCIALPICCVLLFYPSINFKSDKIKGTVTIWCTLAFGNCLGVIFMAIYLIFRVKWDRVVKESQSRLNNTMRNSQSQSRSQVPAQANNQIAKDEMSQEPLLKVSQNQQLM